MGVAGVTIVSHEDGIGWGHALFICQRAEQIIAASPEGGTAA